MNMLPKIGSKSNLLADETLMITVIIGTIIAASITLGMCGINAATAQKNQALMLPVYLIEDKWFCQTL